VASFRYKARNPRGEPVEGRIDAASAAAAAQQLSGAGITPVDIVEIEDPDSAGLGRRLFERPITLDELIIFSRQMYTLTKAGVPIIRAMGGLVETARSPRMQRVLAKVGEGLESGRSLTDSLRQHPDVFSDLYTSIIQVGENSGRLEESFLQIARHLELDKETRERVKTALRYPMIVVVAIAIAVGIINVSVIPAFGQVFASFHAELPLATRVLLGVSNATIEYGVHLLVAIPVAAAALARYLRTEAGGLRWDRIKLRIPVVGDIVLRATLARFARSFAMALRSGVPLVQALAVVSRAVGNAHVGDCIRGMRAGIERGENLTRTAVSTGLFTPLVLQMLMVGEETGQVDDMMQEVAEFYEREVDYDIKRLSAYIEPALIVLVAVMVLILALGVFLPMWDLAAMANR
jgi:MSHA biogenesis protein MshG